MNWGRIARLALVIVVSAGPSMAATTPTLADAAEQRNGALFRKLLAAGGDVNAAQVDGMTALHWAVYNDDAEMAQLLVRSRANVNATNRYGVAPLFLRRDKWQCERRDAVARRRRQPERVASGWGNRPHDGGARRKCGRGESAADPWR
jgi:hypothetical protein